MEPHGPLRTQDRRTRPDGPCRSGGVMELTLPSEFSPDTMQGFIDWNRSVPRELERGAGKRAI